MAAGISQQTRKRAKQAPQAAAQWATARQAMEAQLPNSAQLEMARQAQENGSSYADALKAKFMEHQLPSAEREADRIAAGIHASTPEQVKEQLGEKMGADFSGVRFHTDASSAGQADTIGARAFTTGRDVYFGQGGFDAGVAAHELVHTVQQGSVAADMGTMSAPAGEVQMKPTGNWFARIWEKTVGSMRRSHRRAFDDLMRHKTDNIVDINDAQGNKIGSKNKSSYYDLRWYDRAMYAIKNPLAVLRSWGYRRKAKEDWRANRDAQDIKEQDEIQAYRDSHQVRNKWDTSATNGELPAPAYQPGTTEGEPEYNLIPMEKLYSEVTGLPQIFDTEGHFGVKPENGENNHTLIGVGKKVGLGMSTVDALQTARGFVEAGKDLQKAWGSGLKAEKAKSVMNMAGQMNDMVSNIGSVMGGIGENFKLSDNVGDAMSWADRDLMKIGDMDVKAGNIVSYIGDGLKLINNGIDFFGGAMTKSQLKGANKKIAKIKDGDEKTKMELLSKQANRGASHRMLSGALQTIPLAIGAVSKFTSPLFGNKLSKVINPGLSAGKYVVDKLVNYGISKHQKSMNKDVLNNELDLETKIEEYADALAQRDHGKSLDKLGAFKYRELKKKAKHIILRAYGFSSGKRSEAAAYFTDSRAEYLAEHANNAYTKDKANKNAQAKANTKAQAGANTNIQNLSDTETAAKALVGAMGVGRHKGAYQKDDIAKRLGRGASQDDVAASRGSVIEGLKSKGKEGTVKRFFKWLIGA